MPSLYLSIHETISCISISSFITPQVQSTVKVVPCTGLPSCCQSPVPRCEASEMQVWPSILVRVLFKQCCVTGSINLVVTFRDYVSLTCHVSSCSFNCGENWHDPVKCKVKKWVGRVTLFIYSNIYLY